MPITAPGVNLKNLLPPPAIDPTDRPQEQMTLADMLVHKFKDFVRPVTGKVEHWLNDPEQQANANLLLGGPMGMAHVWHGSPHKFTKFDMSKIGTGEGAQAYGHGLYFADEANTAKSYVPRDTNFEEVLMGRYKAAERAQDYPVMEVYERGMMHDTPEELRSYFSDPEVISGFKKGELKRINSAIDDIASQAYDAGNLYKVDLPDDSIAKMLDWDKPLSEQPESVKQLAEILTSEYTDPKSSKTGMNAYDYISSTLGRQNQSRGHRDMAGTAKYFKDKGIPGIKYLDQGSRGKGKGTYNYVVFDDTLPEILEINGKAFKGLKKKVTK